MWRTYGLQQSQGALPVGPMTIAIHLASVWPPFTSEAKEAIAHYPEIIKELKLALQECGRELGHYVNRKRRVAEQQERVNIFENYIPVVAESLAQLISDNKEKLTLALRKMLQKNREFILAHQAVTQAEGKEKREKSREEQITLKGSFEEESD
jgi:DNA topoisomerase-6 subunit B